MPEIANYAPHFIVIEKSFPAWHSAQANAIFDDPLQLTVCILLNVLRSKIRHWWGHISGEGHIRCVSVYAMTELAVTLEIFGSQLGADRVIGNRIMPVLSTDYQFFALLNEFFLYSAWRFCFATGRI